VCNTCAPVAGCAVGLLLLLLLTVASCIWVDSCEGCLLLLLLLL
jgi:hypothetical protein